MPLFKGKQRDVDYFRKDYVGKSDLRETGFGGTEKEWEYCRKIIVDAIDHDGRFLDVGCANGRLAWDVQKWAAQKNIKLDVFGVDFVPELIEKAKKRFPGKEGHFIISDAFEFSPPETFDYILVAVHLPQDQQEKLYRHYLPTLSEKGKLITTKYDDTTGQEFEKFAKYLNKIDLGKTTFVRNGCTCLGVIQR